MTKGNNNLLTEQQVSEFNQNGLLIVKSFYNLEQEIEPIQYRIYQIIGIVIHKYQLPINQLSFSPDTFEFGYLDLINFDRKIGGEIYDAIKQIPEFVRLVASESHCKLVSQLRQTNLPGIAAGGYGIRIDNPCEEKYRAPWHQDYPAQFRSLDGLVFWSSLVPVTYSLGPVDFCLQSHHDGLVRVHTKDPKNPEKSGAYALILENEENLINRYECVSPESNPGDLIIIDFLTIHRSGLNTGERARWSMQMRYFNFNDSTGIKLGWPGSFATAKNINNVHPELFLN